MFIGLERTADQVVLARKYQFMEVNTQRRKAGLDEKIPDIQKTVETVRFLKTRKVCAPLIRCCDTQFAEICSIF